MSHDYQPKNDPKIYQCPKCGATYAHDEAVNHAVYFCPKREKAPCTSTR
jgi:transcription initiation factor IIE alpha subunit